MTDAELAQIASRAEGGNLRMVAPAGTRGGDLLVVADPRVTSDIPALLAEVKLLRGVVREVEWAGERRDWGESITCCPLCKADEATQYGKPLGYYPHDKGCRLAAALGVG